MSSPSLIEQFHELDSDTEFAVALVISQVVNPDVDVDGFRSQFDQTLQFLELNDGDDVHCLLEWFDQLGFGASAISAADFCHSDIAWVFEHKQGIPITLGILVIEAARRCGLVAHGLNFPGHFLVNVADQLVDPLAMRVVLPDEIKTGNHRLENLLTPATPKMVALRMLNNIKGLHIQSRSIHEALEILDYQVAVDPSNDESVAALDFERGELWQQLGAYSAARDAFSRCAERSPFRQLAEQARERASALAHSDETWH